MIFTSKRCFLNKFIQRNNPETILNANYYILDRKAGNSTAMINEDIRRNEFGQLENVNGSFLTGTTMPMGSIYHIRYNTIIDPEPLSADAVMGENDGFTCGEERYIHYLNKDSTIRGAYKFLFADRLEGNGLQIAILEDDDNALRFGHIICQYLSMVFGVDIIFLDPAFRPTCRGMIQYNGIKENISTAEKIRKHQMVFEFNQAVTQSEQFHSLSNIREHLLGMSLGDLMYLYMLLFPNDQLPPGNYSDDQMRELLMYRAGAGIPTDHNAYANLLIQHDWQSIVDRNASEAMDFAQDDDTGLF